MRNLHRFGLKYNTLDEKGFIAQDPCKGELVILPQKGKAIAYPYGEKARVYWYNSTGRLWMDYKELCSAIWGTVWCH